MTTTPRHFCQQCGLKDPAHPSVPTVWAHRLTGRLRVNRDTPTCAHCLGERLWKRLPWLMPVSVGLGALLLMGIKLWLFAVIAAAITVQVGGAWAAKKARRHIAARTQALATQTPAPEAAPPATHHCVGCGLPVGHTRHSHCPACREINRLRRLRLATLALPALIVALGVRNVEALMHLPAMTVVVTVLWFVVGRTLKRWTKQRDHAVATLHGIGDAPRTPEICDTCGAHSSEQVEVRVYKRLSPRAWRQEFRRCAHCQAIRRWRGLRVSMPLLALTFGGAVALDVTARIGFQVGFLLPMLAPSVAIWGICYALLEAARSRRDGTLEDQGAPCALMRSPG